jgi:pyruvate/2-oxoglutarate dehydrogenase complex dihydrolipoamide dehydrogenase (E3) component
MNATVPVTDRAPRSSTLRLVGGSMLEALGLRPDNEHDRELAANVHPADWVNPTPAGRYNLVVLGGGAAGLVAAAGAAGMGARVALVERQLLGGDCLNVGCVPSKAIISSGRAAAAMRNGDRFGVRLDGEVSVDFAAAMERMRRIRAGIGPHDSARRFTDEYGVDIFLGEASFVGPDQVEVDGTRLRFVKAVIATGARAAVPPIPGLEEAGYLTNHNVFNLTELPPRLAVVGGGPIGTELAQTFARLGSEVVIVEMADRFLPREDRDAVEVLRRALERDGVTIRLSTTVDRVEVRGRDTVLTLTTDGRSDSVAVDAILVAVGRTPNVEGLGLEAAGVEYDRNGVRVDDVLRTSNRRIFATGDVCLPLKFTHVADATSRAVVQNALFPIAGKKKVSKMVIPWVTYTDPEIAHVGESEIDATARGVDVHTITIPMSEVDRALTDGEAEGFLKVRLERGADRILGATVVARHAGDMISEITLAMVNRIGLGSIASVIHPYPTVAEAIRKAADAYNRTRLTPRARRVFERWFAWRR